MWAAEARLRSVRVGYTVPVRPPNQPAMAPRISAREPNGHPGRQLSPPRRRLGWLVPWPGPPPGGIAAHTAEPERALDPRECSALGLTLVPLDPAPPGLSLVACDCGPHCRDCRVAKHGWVVPTCRAPHLVFDGAERIRNAGERRGRSLYRRLGGGANGSPDPTKRARYRIVGPAE